MADPEVSNGVDDGALGGGSGADGTGLADPLHAAWAKAHGVEAAPMLLVYPVGAEAPITLDYRATSAQLARHFERDREVEKPADPEAPK